MQASHTGRLLRYDPASGRTDVLADGLWFANGVALAPDGSYVVVAETMRARLLRVWLRGTQARRSPGHLRVGWQLAWRVLRCLAASERGRAQACCALLAPVCPPASTYVTTQ